MLSEKTLEAWREFAKNHKEALNNLAIELGKPGWVIRDISWTQPELFQELLDTLGEDHVEVISMTALNGSVRGLLAVDPDKIEEIKELRGKVRP